MHIMLHGTQYFTGEKDYEHTIRKKQCTHSGGEVPDDREKKEAHYGALRVFCGFGYCMYAALYRNFGNVNC